MANWKEITTLEEWEQLKANSAEKQTVILKHSTRCPVSTSALEEYDSYLNASPNSDTDYYLVKVIEARPASNQIADDLKVTHASPQIILFKDGKSVWNTSHWSVTKKHIAAVLD